MTALQITNAHRALAAYLRSRETDFGTLSDLAYEVLNGVHRQAFIELTGTDRFDGYGSSQSQYWTDAYRRVLALVDNAPILTALDVTAETALDVTAKEVEPNRDAQAAALATMRRREAEANQQRDAAHASYAALRSRVEELNVALNEQAIERDWCSEFEDFVDNFSDMLTMRETTYTVTLEVTRVRNSNDHHTMADYLYELDRSDLYYAIQSVD